MHAVSPFFALAHGVLNFMTFYLVHCDRNDHITVLSTIAMP